MTSNSRKVEGWNNSVNSTVIGRRVYPRGLLSVASNVRSNLEGKWEGAHKNRRTPYLVENTQNTGGGGRKGAGRDGKGRTTGIATAARPFQWSSIRWPDHPSPTYSVPLSSFFLFFIRRQCAERAHLMPDTKLAESCNGGHARCENNAWIFGSERNYEAQSPPRSRLRQPLGSSIQTGSSFGTCLTRALRADVAG